MPKNWKFIDNINRNIMIRAEERTGSRRTFESLLRILLNMVALKDFRKTVSKIKSCWVRVLRQEQTMLCLLSFEII